MCRRALPNDNYRLSNASKNSHRDKRSAKLVGERQRTPKIPIDELNKSGVHRLLLSMALHTLIIPRRHVTSFFELTEDEVAAVHELLCRMKDHLDNNHKPGGYNIGINVGTVAGQTVPHVHVHLIPRYADDVANPVGGVRNIIPGQGSYL